VLLRGAAVLLGAALAGECRHGFVPASADADLAVFAPVFVHVAPVVVVLDHGHAYLAAVALIREGELPSEAVLVLPREHLDRFALVLVGPVVAGPVLGAVVDHVADDNAAAR
jgi:hypothetical protein